MVTSDSVIPLETFNGTKVHILVHLAALADAAHNRSERKGGGAWGQEEGGWVGEKGCRAGGGGGAGG